MIKKGLNRTFAKFYLIWESGKNLRERGVVKSKYRIVLPKRIREELKIKVGDYYEMETYGKDKILITFFKVRKDEHG